MKLARQALARAEARLKRPIPLLRFADLKLRVNPVPLAALAAELASRADLDLPERAKLLTQQAWLLSGLSGPAVVMGFGSIPYPAVSLRDDSLKALIAETVKAHGLGTVNYFPGISDMSFVGEASGDVKTVSENTPTWRTSFTLAEPAGYPCVNIGPWGRDYHHWLERLHAPYAFETLPRVLISVIDAVAKSG